MRALVNSLPETDQDFLRETEAARLKELDEDEVLELHQRVRRARNKNVSAYRRQAAARVPAQGARGAAHPKNSRARDRAEVYEEALARVSARVQVLARQAAKELREERLAAAAADGSGPMMQAPSKEPASKPVAATARKTTGGVKKDASSRAAGARRQAMRDAR